MFIIIGDYHYNTLKNYLITAPYEKKIDYQLIKSTGSGSIAGIKKSISNLKNNTKIVITWSDILFTSKPKLKLDKFTKLGVTNKFKCRFSVKNTNEIVKNLQVGDISVLQKAWGGSTSFAALYTGYTAADFLHKYNK